MYALRRIRSRLAAAPRSPGNQLVPRWVLRDENVRIRETAIDFLNRSTQRDTTETLLLEFPALRKEFELFTLEVKPGTVYEDEILGIFGRNGLGKTTVAWLLTGTL